MTGIEPTVVAAPSATAVSRLGEASSLDHATTGPAGHEGLPVAALPVGALPVVAVADPEHPDSSSMLPTATPTVIHALTDATFLFVTDGLSRSAGWGSIREWSTGARARTTPGRSSRPT
ncbi:MAG: hypothetical protein IPH03_02410 [Tetrasphaera sp.]|nr:hypothetical protein [Tetrasphaera sp.]